MTSLRSISQNGTVLLKMRRNEILKRALSQWRFHCSCTLRWERLASTTRLALRFLNDPIEVGRCPAPKIAALVQANR
jgi:hypothetical protein